MATNQPVNSKITALEAATKLSDDDLFLIIDASDHSMADTGTDKKLAFSQLFDSLTIAAGIGVRDEPNGYVGIDADGNSFGQFVPRRGNTEYINGLILSEGELAYNTDTNTLIVGDGIAAGGTSLLRSISSQSCLRVGATSPSPVVNGDALRAAKVEASLSTPYGHPLSVTNRFTLLLEPGSYDLTSTGLVHDTPYLDIVGIGGSAATLLTSSDPSGTLIHKSVADTKAATVMGALGVAVISLANHGYSVDDWVYVTGASRATFNGPHRVTVSNQNDFHYAVIGTIGVAEAVTVQKVVTDSRIKGITLEINLPSGNDVSVPTKDTPAAYFPDPGLQGYAMEDVVCRTVTSKAIGMRAGIAYYGTWSHCACGDYSFGYGSEITGGRYTGCIVGNFGFAATGTIHGGRFFNNEAGISSWPASLSGGVAVGNIQNGVLWSGNS